MAKEFPLELAEVKSVETKYRKLSGQLPNAETIEKLKTLRKVEARSMRGQPPVIWDRAEKRRSYHQCRPRKKENSGCHYKAGLEAAAYHILFSE